MANTQSKNTPDEILKYIADYLSSDVPQQVRESSAAKLNKLIRSWVTSTCFAVFHRRDEDFIHDTTQDIFLKLPSFRRESSFPTWVYVLAKNAALTQLNQQKKSLETLSEKEFNSLSTNGLTFEHLDLERAIAGLPSEEQTFVAQFLNSTSFRALGSHFGRNESWAIRKWEEISKKLKDQLGE